MGHIPVSVGCAVGRPDRAVGPAEAAVTLARRSPVLADEAIQEHVPMAGALCSGHRLCLAGRLQRPAELATGTLVEQGRREEMVCEEHGVEEQRGEEEDGEAWVGRPKSRLLPASCCSCVHCIEHILALCLREI
jgi:hypothetical protein